MSQLGAQFDGVIVWPSLGSGGASSGGGGTATRRRDFKRFQVLDTGFEGVFVWNSVGATGTTTPTQTQVIAQVFGGGFDAWEDYVKAVHEKRRLELELKKKKVELKKVEKKIAQVEKKTKGNETPVGILANLQTLESKREEIKAEVKAKSSEIISMQWVIESIEIDDDDEEILLM